MRSSNKKNMNMKIIKDIWPLFKKETKLTEEHKEIFRSKWKKLNTFTIILTPEMLKKFHEFLLILKEKDSNPQLKLIIWLKLPKDTLELDEEIAEDLVQICEQISPRKFKLKGDNNDRTVLNDEVLKILNKIFLNENLISLDLSNNTLKGSSKLLGLQASKKLEILNLSGCSLGYNKVQRIIELLETLPDLKELDLSNNSTMRDEIHLIFEALSKSNKKIEEFNISQNHITDKTLSCIISILLKGTHFNLLKRLDLSGYKLTPEGNVNTVTSDQKKIITNILARYPFPIETEIIVGAEVDYYGKRRRETGIKLVSLTHSIPNFFIFQNEKNNIHFKESSIKFIHENKLKL